METDILQKRKDPFPKTLANAGKVDMAVGKILCMMPMIEIASMTTGA